MAELYLGIDTSNYTTSAAVFDGDRVLENRKKLLPVKPGERGLIRQMNLSQICPRDLFVIQTHNPSGHTHDFTVRRHLFQHYRARPDF